MGNKILLIGGSSVGLATLALQDIKEKYGEDVEVYTPEEAKKLGLKQEDFSNIPTMQISNTYPAILWGNSNGKIGKQNRRERRAKERKSKK